MLAMGRYLAPCEFFENMPQLKRFGLYFEKILNRKWLYFHIDIVLSDTEMLGGSSAYPRENFEMIDTIWCVMMYYFDQI